MFLFNASNVWYYFSSYNEILKVIINISIATK